MRRDRDLWVDLASAKSPTLLVYGSESHFFTPGVVQAMMKANRNLSVVRIEGATHYLPMTHVEETLDAVNDFMQNKVRT
jgi:pimeloyl-ACP methyl ester carboxylesterase